MKQRSMKRALLMSALSMLVCLSMLIGSTFAWFTDSVSSLGNTIQSGSLKVDLVDKNGNTLEGKELTYAGGEVSGLWEPGCTYSFQEVFVKNEGSLALKYEIAINGIKGDAKLLEVIDWTVTVDGVTTEIADLNGFLLPETQSKAIVLTGHMREEAGNEYQGLTVEGISISVFATQFTHEYDSFDNQYDNVTVVSTADELKAAVQTGGNVLLANDIVVTDWTATIAKNVETNLYLNGQTISATTTIYDKNGDNKINASDNYNVFLVNQGGTLNIIGAGEINVAHTAGDMVWDAMTTIAHAYGDVNVSNGAQLKNFGGTAMAFALNVYSGGNITVEDSFLGSTYCAMRAFNAQAGAESVVDVKNSALVSYNWNRAFWAQYDKELTVKGVLTEAEATEAGNTIYGSVRHAGMSDSALWVGGEEGAYPTMVTTAKALQDAIDADKTNIVLVKDIVGNVTVTQKPDVKITIDGNGNEFDGVITVDGKSATYTTAGLTIKNIKFVADSISADACIQLGDGTNATRYTCNVTVDGCTFDVPEVVGVKSYTGGDKNVTITNCVATANAHSLAQLKGVDGVLVEKCTVNAVRGINFNNSLDVTVKDSTFDVQKYAVRFGESANDVVEEYVISNCTLTSANGDGDAAIVLRKGATNANLTLDKVTINAGIKMAGTDSANVVIK